MAQRIVGKAAVRDLFDTPVGEASGVHTQGAGNYIFHDAFQTAIGTCGADDAAFSVLAAVIGLYPERREVVVNAGALALSKDRGAVHVDPDCGYGLVVTPSGQRVEGVRVVG